MSNFRKDVVCSEMLREDGPMTRLRRGILTMEDISNLLRKEEFFVQTDRSIAYKKGVREPVDYAAANSNPYEMDTYSLVISDFFSPFMIFERHFKAGSFTPAKVMIRIETAYGPGMSKRRKAMDFVMEGYAQKERGLCQAGNGSIAGVR